MIAYIVAQSIAFLSMPIYANSDKADVNFKQTIYFAGKQTLSIGDEGL